MARSLSRLPLLLGILFQAPATAWSRGLAPGDALFTEGAPPSRNVGKSHRNGTPSASSFGDLATTVGPAVVFIRAVYRPESGAARAPSVGSGFIIHRSGYVVTNHHVIDGADELRVRLHDDRYLAADVVGTDPRSDIALLKVDTAQPLPVARLGDSDGLRVGEWVVAIGNPWNFDHSVTAGIVSAVGRSDVRPATNAQMFANFIQTDTAINQGNSGGPLINLRGEVIGINSAIFRPQKEGGAEGINFAIPINMAKQLLPVLYRFGHVPRPWFGAEGQAISPWLAQAFRLGDRGGALIARIKEGSPADRAGLKPGDVVTEYADTRISRHSELEWQISLTPPGTTVPLRVIRDGKAIALKVTLAASPDSAAAPRKPRPRRPPSTVGIAVTEITPELARQRKLPAVHGVVVMEVDDGSPALEAGLQRDDVVVRMGSRDVRTLDDYVAGLKQIKPGELILLLVSRGDERFWAAFPRR